MPTEVETHVIPEELLIEMRERALRAARGIRDEDDVRKACERMDRMREELRERIGETQLAVELVREARNQE
jgi:hypothetical protein